MLFWKKNCFKKNIIFEKHFFFENNFFEKAGNEEYKKIWRALYESKKLI